MWLWWSSYFFYDLKKLQTNQIRKLLAIWRTLQFFQQFVGVIIFESIFTIGFCYHMEYIRQITLFKKKHIVVIKKFIALQKINIMVICIIRKIVSFTYLLFHSYWNNFLRFSFRQKFGSFFCILFPHLSINHDSWNIQITEFATI